MFPGRIIVQPLSSRATAAIGSNVIGGILDEANYFDTVERSKRSPNGGEYDQALEAHGGCFPREWARKAGLFSRVEAPEKQASQT